MVNEKIYKKVCTLFLTFLFSACVFNSQAQLILPEQEEWVDSVFSTLNIEQKIGQLIMIPAHAGGNEQHYQDLFEKINDYQVGGVVFNEGNPMAQAKLLNILQQKSEIPLLTAMELDGGLGSKLDSTLVYPTTLGLGAITSDSLIYAAGREVALQLQRLGIDFFIGPSIDLSNPTFYQSFSDDPNQVIHKAKYYIKGFYDAGLPVVIKNLPGLGSASYDQHLGLPVTKKTLEELKNEDLYPFNVLLDKRLGGAKTGFIYAPEIYNDGLPLMMNAPFVKNIREEMQFDELLFTADLSHQAITDNFKKGVAEELSIRAGHDILLFPDNISATIRRIRRSVKKGEISEGQLNASVKKILNFKYEAGLSKAQPVDTINLYQDLNTISSRKLQRELALNSITLLKNRNNDIPYQVLEDRNFAFLDLRDNPAGFLTSYLRKYTRIDYFPLLNAELAEKIKSYDVVITAVSGELADENLALLKEVEDATNLSLVLFGSPYFLAPYTTFGNIVWVPENTPLTQQLIPQLLFGAEPFSGQLPVTVDIFVRGSGISTKSLNRLAFSFPEDAGVDGDYLIRIDSIMKEAISSKATPGGQVLIAKDGKVIWEKSYGYQTYDSLAPVDDFTIYDLASITKVAASVQALMFLYERGLVDLDKKISYYLPELEGSNKENMILRDILTHQAGLWPYLPFWRETMQDDTYSPEFYSYYPEQNFFNEVIPGLYSSTVTEDSVWQWVIDSKLRKKEPRIPYDYKYSDMGYYIIHRLVESIINQPIEDFLNQNLYDPMGMTTMGYQPLCNFPLSCIAPTEMDEYFRFSLVAGTVHDQGAAMIGGIAGHAGLFSNALDLAKLMQLMLQKGDYGGREYFQPETIEHFTNKQYTSNRRGLGWDKPLLDEWGGPTSELASGETFGHTGFTGTAAWVDPEFDLVYIFLSNRIHPDAENTKLITTNVRTRIQDIIYKAIFRALQYEDIQ